MAVFRDTATSFHRLLLPPQLITMWLITTKKPLKQIPVEITACPHCQCKTATLYINHITQYIRLIAVIKLLKTQRSNVEAFCTSCHKYIRNKYLSPAVQTLAKEEKAM
jgi:hypothetical protein